MCFIYRLNSTEPGPVLFVPARSFSSHREMLLAQLAQAAQLVPFADISSTFPVTFGPVVAPCNREKEKRLKWLKYGPPAATDQEKKKYKREILAFLPFPPLVLWTSRGILMFVLTWSEVWKHRHSCFVALLSGHGKLFSPICNVGF